MLESEILKKYLKAPTLAEMFSFIEEVGVSYAQFERYYGIAKGTIKNVKAGNKGLPIKYWSIFYERTVPQYGVTFKKTKKRRKKKIQKVSNQVSAKQPQSGILSKIKDITNPGE